MNSYSTHGGRVVVEFGEHHTVQEVSPEQAEAMAAGLLEAASDARRRVSCTEPRIPEHAVVTSVIALSSTCACGESIYLADEPGAVWTHSRDL